MSTRTLFLIIQFLIIQPIYSQCEFLDSLRLSIASFKSDSTFKSYYKAVEEYEFQLQKGGRIDSLKPCDRFYLHKPITANDSTVYRKYLMHHAVKIKNGLGDYNYALDFYLLAHKFAISRKKLDKNSWYIEKLIGDIYARQNEYGKAIYFLKLTIPSLLEFEMYGRLSRLYSDLGDNYLWLGNFSKMHQSYKEGLHFAKLSRDSKAFHSLYSNLADYYINYYKGVSKLDSFLFYANKGEEALSKIEKGRDHDLRKAELLELNGDLFFYKEEYNKAIELYFSQLVLLKDIYNSKKSREIAKIYQRIAESFYLNGSLTSCQENIEYGLKYLVVNKGHERASLSELINQENTYTGLLHLRSKYFYNLYQSDKKKKNLDSAIAAIDLAVLSNDQLDAKILMQGARYASVKVNKKLISSGLEYCYEGLSQFKENEYVKKARKYFDESKSKILNDIKGKNNTSGLFTSEDKDKYENLLLDLRDLQSSEELTDSVEIIQVELKNEIDNLFGKYGKSKSVLRPIVYDYLEYAVADSCYFLYTNNTEPKFFKIDNKKNLDDLIDSIGLNILTIDENDFPVLEYLYKELIPIPLSHKDRLVIIPDGKLSYMPFEMLRNNNEFLIQQKTISVQPHRLSQQFKNSQSGSIDVYCVQPQYPRSIYVAENSTERGGIFHLPFAEAEVKNLQELFDNVQLKHLPTRQEIHSGFNSNQIFHFAGHSIVNQDSAYLVLNKNEDRLTLGELELMKNSLELVTLSSCETGLGIYKPGEGIRSLANSVLLSGAKSIVYSLWNANDQSTSKIMIEFYANLKNGFAKDHALRQAKLNYIIQNPEAINRPFYWATFVVAGDLNPIVSKGNYIIYALLLLGMSVMAFYLITKN